MEKRWIFSPIKFRKLINFPGNFSMVGVLFFKKKIQQNVVRMLTKEFQIPSNQPYCFNVFFSFFNLEENQWQVVMKKKNISNSTWRNENWWKTLTKTHVLWKETAPRNRFCGFMKNVKKCSDRQNLHRNWMNEMNYFVIY